jgi:DNA-binding NtrC family response regulator
MPDLIRVLLTDDEAEFADPLARALGRRGIVVELAPDGTAGLAILAQREFDVILLDLRMPGLDGLATLAEIRKRDVLTPVILLSGQADLPSVTAALRDGAANFLAKPCAVETLASAIEDAAERKAYARELARRSGDQSSPSRRPGTRPASE